MVLIGIIVAGISLGMAYDHVTLKGHAWLDLMVLGWLLQEWPISWWACLVFAGFAIDLWLTVRRIQRAERLARLFAPRPRRFGR